MAHFDVTEFSWLTFETRWWIPGDEEKCSHWMHFTEWWLTLSHFQGGDAQRPQITSIIVRGFWVLIAGNHFRGHPNQTIFHL